MTSDFRVYFVTWNVGEVGPTKDFTNLLSLDSKVLPNMYAIGLQELKASSTSLLVDALFDDPWTLALTDCLYTRDYVRIESKRLYGTHLAIFVRRTDLPNITNIESTYTRTGLHGYWGSKGAISVRMDVYGVSMCIVNAHLTAHQENYSPRILSYNTIIDSQRFHAKDTETILDHDYVFFFGDLNFRINGENAEVRKKIADRNFQHLLKLDQLNIARSEELILIDFEEGPLNFAPTFKYNVGTHDYDTSSKNRVPSWCDRVLWHVHKDAYTNVELSVQQLRYTSIEEYVDSDHKPVIAEFLVQVLSNNQPLPVLFEPVGQWKIFCDNSISYTITSDFPVSSRDWIGLYKSTHQHLRDYATYVWASIKGDDIRDGTFMYTVKFGEEYLHRLEPGDYHLIYFSAARNTPVGYSDRVQLTTADDESTSSDDDRDIDDTATEVTEADDASLVASSTSDTGSKKEL